MNVFKATLDTRHQNGVIATVTQFDNAVLELQVLTDGVIDEAWEQPQFELIAMKRDNNPVREVEQDKFTVASNGNSNGLSLGHHVNENYVEDILCDSNGVVTVQRQMNHAGIYNNTYGQMFVGQFGQGGWEITGRSDSQSIKPGGANQGALGSNTQYINQSWIANRQNPSSLEFKHLSHYVSDADCLKLVSEVQPARYFYKEYDEDGNDVTTFCSHNSQLGLIYEDVRECSGRDLLTNEDEKAINDYNMSSVMWGAIRNVNSRLNEVEYENVVLREENETLKNELAEIKQMLMQVLGQE